MAKSYSIVGSAAEQAKAKGLLDAEWYQCEISRKNLKQFMERKDHIAWRDIFLWFILLGVIGYFAYLSWGTWFSVPLFLLYSIVYTTPAIAKWHEFSHGTPFKTSWLNEVMYYITSFMILVPGTDYRWGHTKHHSNTIIVGGDPQIFTTKPPSWSNILLKFSALEYIRLLVTTLPRYALGILNKEQKAYIPKNEQWKLFTEIRVWLLLLSAVLGLCVYVGSILPLMYVGIPFFIGFPFNFILIITQHGGLAEDVLDHRLNTRTFYTNRFLRFLYSEMNYHLEHHMFPSVPYYHLAKLHEEIKHDCPPAYPSLTSAFIAAMRALWRQRKSPFYHEVRELPSVQKS